MYRSVIPCIYTSSMNVGKNQSVVAVQLNNQIIDENTYLTSWQHFICRPHRLGMSILVHNFAEYLVTFLQKKKNLISVHLGPDFSAS